MATQMTTLKLIDAIIRTGASEKSFARGQELYRNGTVSATAILDNVLTGYCEGALSLFYNRCRPKWTAAEFVIDPGIMRIDSVNQFEIVVFVIIGKHAQFRH